MIRSALLAAGIVVVLHAPPVHATDKQDADACRRTVEQARRLLVQLPLGDPSRRFAENDLQTALIEAASGEVDECPELVARARDVIKTRPYRLRPGERMHGYGPDQPG